MSCCAPVLEGLDERRALLADDISARQINPFKLRQLAKASSCSFDHLVGAGEERGWDR